MRRYLASIILSILSSTSFSFTSTPQQHHVPVKLAPGASLHQNDENGKLSTTIRSRGPDGKVRTEVHPDVHLEPEAGSFSHQKVDFTTSDTSTKMTTTYTNGPLRKSMAKELAPGEDKTTTSRKEDGSGFTLRRYINNSTPTTPTVSNK